ncbi:MAG: hypothetical protein Q7R66_15135 [Undibacterium sp.]|uniref:hypothetical protein n=1 Tax=Undibacterium sp. TaxID=1914977 RepID=UPI00271AEA73|nr:hypothetical protein [Undibacterium sp.]MDO8653516.1 hypothetical protein [Undibacterium sp.]
MHHTQNAEKFSLLPKAYSKPFICSPASVSDAKMHTSPLLPHHPDRVTSYVSLYSLTPMIKNFIVHIKINYKNIIFFGNI